MKNVRTLVLNEGQTLASRGFFEFLLGDEKELNISGPGGVGKTFTMGYMIDEILPQYFDTCKLMGIQPEYHSVHMTATTNKAAEVLGQQTGRPASTVHSFFGLKVFDDYSTGESKVTKSNNWTVYQGIILFIDEASMIDRQLYEYILEGTVKSKIVYVGDKNQLAPVKETLSPVYKKSSIRMFELLEPMRTSIPELQALNSQCRTTVEELEKGNEDAFQPIYEVPGIIDFIDDEQFLAEIDANLKDPEHKNVILAYTNKRVVEYNSYIRGLRGLPVEFQAGDVLINNSAIRLGKFQLSVEDEVHVDWVSPETEWVDISNDVKMEIRQARLINSFGDTINCKLPVDRSHYNELVKYFRKCKAWTPYYELKNKYPDLRERDARTVYKIQGSSVDTVYIDADNLNTCHNPAQAARLIYVAVSRARYRVAIYGQLASKYGGMVPA